MSRFGGSARRGPRCALIPEFRADFEQSFTNLYVYIARPVGVRWGVDLGKE
jgi:hypothetical protein